MEKDLTGIDWGTTRSTYYFTTAEMKNTLTYLSGYWDMLSIRTNAIWDINSEINDGYPYLVWTHTIETQDAVEPIVGNGSEENPYQIANLANLRWLYENEDVWDKYFIQTADIDAKEAKYWERRNRIGTSQTNFTGSYNGNFNIIDNLTIELFGVIDNATIEKVVVTNALYANYDSAGGIVDYAKNSKISQTSFSGIIYSSYNLGGICGTNKNTIIEESFSDGAIYGKIECIGGIVGRNYDGIIKNNYSTSSLSASKYDQVWSVGGIIGCHESESAIIEYNYFAGTFENRVDNAKGIIAYVYSNAYPAVDKGNLWDTDISQVTDNLGNGIGLSSSEMKDLDTYTDAMWLLKYPNAENPAWNIGNGKNNGYPYLNWQYPDDDYIDIPQYAFVDFVEINLIGRNTVEGQLNVIYIGNPVATEFGVCYTIGGTPTTSDETVTISSAINIGQFAFEITDLEEGEVYSFRAYAKNEVGTFYCEEVIQITLNKEVPVGDGTKENPYLISNFNELYWVSENSDSWDKHFVQTADIDAMFSQSALSAQGGLNPIGNESDMFTGSYNGNYKTISNLIINRPNTDYVGLFGYTNSATIEKLSLVNVEIEGKNDVGGVVGYSFYSTLSQTSVIGLVKGYNRIGGICGTCYWSTIKASFSDSDIYTSYDYNGGIVGSNRNGTIENCYSLSVIHTEDNSFSGGIAGGSNDGTMINNYFAGTFSGTSEYRGGIIGWGSTPTIDKGNLWDVDISQVTRTIGYGVGLSTAEMKDVYTFSDKKWILKYVNFENPVWNIGNGKNNGYPYLNWQYPDDGYIDIPQLAYIDFDEVNLIGRTTVEVQLNLSYIGNPVATKVGVCYAFGGTPTENDDKVYITSGFDNNTIILEVENLEEGEVYTFRAYAINEVGTSYGKEIVKTILYSQVPEGDGTETTPYLISNFNELYWVSENSDSWDKHFLQTADIDASFSQSVLSEQGGLNPIGTVYEKFEGHYNGNYKTISNLTINRPNRDRIGLFGFIDNAIIEKLQLKNVNIRGDNTVGGIVGYSDRNSVISQTSVQGIVTGNNEVGGICGDAYYALIEESFSDATINATYMFAYSGGIVGSNNGSTIINNYSISENSGFNSGGIIGSNRRYNDGIVENNYFAGTFGWGSTNKGGIIGGGEIPKIDKGNLWDTEISEVAETIGNGEAKATIEMTDLSTFINAGWNMKLLNSINYGVWNIGNGKNNGYPYLRWQFPEDEGVDIESVAKISIDEITIVNEISANITLNINYVGNPIATEFGVCYSEIHIPTIDDNKLDFSNIAEGKYEFVLDNLEENSGYYFRAYIINDKGTTYSDIVTIITLVANKPKGEGTEEKPYRISNFSELLWISENSDSWDKHFVQTDDIDASLSKFLNKGKGFSPIGNRDLDIYFTGTYSGGYHKIDNLFINRPEESCQGLFGAINEGYIEKLYLNNVNITGGAYVGGLVGFMYSSASLYQVSVSGVVNGVDNVGGIIGYNSGLIEQSYFVGDVSGIYSVGGITGFNMRGEIINCYSISNLIGEEDSPIGGIIGLNYSFYSTVVNNFFVGTIDSETTRKGGIIGADNVANTSSGNFWDYDVSNLLENIGEGEAISTAEMKTINTFVNAGWEFVGLGGDEIWDIDSEINDGYPYLAWILNEKEDIGVGVIDNSVNNSTISIHPNPFTNVVNITGNGITRVKVYTTSGVQILDTKYNSESEITIQTSDFGQGIYLFVVEDGGNVETYKLIKR